MHSAKYGAVLKNGVTTLTRGRAAGVLRRHEIDPLLVTHVVPIKGGECFFPPCQCWGLCSLLRPVSERSCLQQGGEHVEKFLPFDIAAIVLKNEADTSFARCCYTGWVIINEADDLFHCSSEGDYIAILDRNAEGRTKKLAPTETMVSNYKASARKRLKRWEAQAPQVG